MYANYEKYAHLRDSTGLSDYAVSKATQVSQSTFSEWKKGKGHIPKMDKICKISDFFGVPLDYWRDDEKKGAK